MHGPAPRSLHRYDDDAEKLHRIVRGGASFEFLMSLLLVARCSGWHVPVLRWLLGIRLLRAYVHARLSFLAMHYLTARCVACCRFLRSELLGSRCLPKRPVF